jgi:hypothetical protein
MKRENWSMSPFEPVSDLTMIHFVGDRQVSHPLPERCPLCSFYDCVALGWAP